MALIKCSECGKEISDKAKTCIHCGYENVVLNNENNEKCSECGVEINSNSSVCFNCGNPIEKKRI